MARPKCCDTYSILCRILSSAWLIAGIVFSCLAVVSCSFLSRNGALTFGLFSSGTANGECYDIDYADGLSQHGWLHTWAAVCGIIAPILGACVFILTVFDLCCTYCCSSTLKSFILSGAELSQGMTFVFFASDACVQSQSGQGIQLNANDENYMWEGCQLEQGGIYSIIAFCCFFLAGCWFCFSPKPDPIFCQKDDEDAKPAADAPQAAAAPAADEENAAAAPPAENPAANEEDKPAAQVY